MQLIITVGNFNVRLVNDGEKYGRDLCLTHNEQDPLIEFYDARYPHTPLGQFVSRYYARTILETTPERGLSLDGGIPEWSVTSEELTRVRDVIAQIIKQGKTA